MQSFIYWQLFTTNYVRFVDCYKIYFFAYIQALIEYIPYNYQFCLTGSGLFDNSWNFYLKINHIFINFCHC